MGGRKRPGEEDINSIGENEGSRLKMRRGGNNGLDGREGHVDCEDLQRRPDEEGDILHEALVRSHRRIDGKADLLLLQRGRGSQGAAWINCTSVQ